MALNHKRDDDLEFIPEDPTKEFITTDTGERKKFSSNQTSLKLLNFICPKCNINCGSHNMWKEHMYIKHNFPRDTNNHNMGSIGCKLCSFRCSDKQAIDKIYHHFPKHMPNNHYVMCTICKLVFNSPIDGEYHICSYHRVANAKTTQSMNICNKCDKLIAYKVQLPERIIANHMAVCRKCEQRFVIQ